MGYEERKLRKEYKLRVMRTKAPLVILLLLIVSLATAYAADNLDEGPMYAWCLVVTGISLMGVLVIGMAIFITWVTDDDF